MALFQSYAVIYLIYGAQNSTLYRLRMHASAEGFALLLVLHLERFRLKCFPESGQPKIKVEID